MRTIDDSRDELWSEQCPCRVKAHGNAGRWQLAQMPKIRSWVDSERLSLLSKMFMRLLRKTFKLPLVMRSCQLVGITLC